MDKIIVYVDDAAYAQQHLVPMKLSGHAAGPGDATHWVLVACAPCLTRRISKWVSHSARENWRTKWSEKLFAQITPALKGRGDQVTTVLAKGPLPALTDKLINQHGTARVLDVRRPKFGLAMEPVTADQPASGEGRWSLPGAAIGMGAILVLAAE